MDSTGNVEAFLETKEDGKLIVLASHSKEDDRDALR